jgi:hypothetical protein
MTSLVLDIEAHHPLKGITATYAYAYTRRESPPQVAPSLLCGISLDAKPAQTDQKELSRFY